jgi:hypothetical protein
MEAVTPVPALGVPLVSKGTQTEVQLPVQALTAAELLVPWVSLVKAYNVQPEALTRKEPRLAFWPTLTAAGEVGVAMGAIVAVATGMPVAVAMGIAVAVGAEVAVDPVTGITVAGLAVGVADAHAERTIETMSRVENKILLFMTILLAMSRGFSLPLEWVL